MSRRGNIRRSGGGGGGGSGGGIGLATPAELLGSGLAFDWDSRVGGVGQNWTARTGQTALGAGTPVLAADGANFKGLPVWKFLLASAQRMETGVLSTLIPAGNTSAYVSLIFRATTASGGTSQVYAQLNDAAEGAQSQMRVTSLNTWNCRFTADITATPPAFDQLVHRLEWFMDGGFGPGEVNMVLDGAPVAGSGGIQSIVANVTRIAIGAASAAGAGPGDVNIASLRGARVAPLYDPAGTFDPLRVYQQLRAYDAAVWGTT